MTVAVYYWLVIMLLALIFVVCCAISIRRYFREKTNR